MAQRTRSILIDNTLGKIFTGVDTVANALANNLIAGTQVASKGVSSPSTTTVTVTKNLGGGSGIYFPHLGIITSVVMTAATASTGTAIVIALKKSSTSDYNSATQVATFTLPAGSKISTTSCSLTFAAGSYYFVDVTQVGSTKPGNGLSVQFQHYMGY
jgi:hypothetical protein